VDRVGLVSSFAALVQEATEDVIGPALARTESKAFLEQPERRVEAEAVDPCVQRMADYEVDPPSHGKGVGRFAPASMTPPLGQLLGKKRRALTDDQVVGVREGILLALGAGFASVASIEADMGEKASCDVGADPKRLWDLWVVRLNSDALDSVGLAPDFQKFTRDAAMVLFTNRLRQLDLMPKVRKRMRYELVGMWYGQAGMILRLIQDGMLAGDLDESSDIWQVTNSWPFER
jgi:hypothetical protein